MALIGKPCPSIGGDAKQEDFLLAQILQGSTEEHWQAMWCAAGLVFLKGDPVEIPTKTGPMVVEFWASWCGPCRMAFPHLSALQRKYKDKGLVVVGISLEEDGPQTRSVA